MTKVVTVFYVAVQPVLPVVQPPDLQWKALRHPPLYDGYSGVKPAKSERGGSRPLHIAAAAPGVAKVPFRRGPPCAPTLHFTSPRLRRRPAQARLSFPLRLYSPLYLSRFVPVAPPALFRHEKRKILSVSRFEAVTFICEASAEHVVH